MFDVLIEAQGGYCAISGTLDLNPEWRKSEW